MDQTNMDEQRRACSRRSAIYVDRSNAQAEASSMASVR